MYVLCMTYKRKAPLGKILPFFQDALKTAFSINLTHRRTQAGHNFPKLEYFFCTVRALFSIFKKNAGETSFAPLVGGERHSLKIA